MAMEEPKRDQKPVHVYMDSVYDPWWNYDFSLSNHGGAKVSEISRRCPNRTTTSLRPRFHQR